MTHLTAGWLGGTTPDGSDADRDPGERLRRARACASEGRLLRAVFLCLEAREEPPVAAEANALLARLADGGEVPVLSRLPAGDRGRVLGAARPRRLPAGEILPYPEGGDCLLLIARGELAVVGRAPWGGEVELGRAREGEVLGLPEPEEEKRGPRRLVVTRPAELIELERGRVCQGGGAEAWRRLLELARERMLRCAGVRP